MRSEPAREASDSTQLEEAGREEARRESVAWQLLGQVPHPRPRPRPRRRSRPLSDPRHTSTAPHLDVFTPQSLHTSTSTSPPPPLAPSAPGPSLAPSSSQAHADADDDAAAISCLRRAVAADAQNLAALLALGVSYTNELDASRALDHLRLWLRRHPDFASLAPAEEEAQSAARLCSSLPTRGRQAERSLSLAERVGRWARGSTTSGRGRPTPPPSSCAPLAGRRTAPTCTPCSASRTQPCRMVALSLAGRRGADLPRRAAQRVPRVRRCGGPTPRGVFQRRRGAAVRLTSSCEQVSSFERALELRPEEHSLWSKPLSAAM